MGGPVAFECTITELHSNATGPRTEFDIGPVTAPDNAAVCCFRLYETEDLPLTLDPPHETKAKWTSQSLG